MTTVEKTPLFIGLRAARANLLPGLIIQAAMILLVLAYYFFAPARDWFALLARAKRDGGYLFTAAAAIIAGALLPQLLTVCIFQRGKFRRRDFDELLFLAIFWSLNGMLVDAFYRLQAVMFGPQVDISTVVKKLLVDQFLYNTIVAAPIGLACYEWKNQRYSLGSMSRVLTWTFYKNKTVPALIATWVVWIPVCAAIYSLPPLLQIPLYSLALTFWVMMFAYITARRGGQTKPNEAALTAAAGAVE
jgi:hypothetical protein